MNNPTKKYEFTEIFTVTELNNAIDIIAKIRKSGGFVVSKDLIKTIISPALERINKTTGQENEEKYLGYMLEHVCVNVLNMKKMEGE